MYVTKNPRSKKALREAVARGERIEVFSPGPFPAKRNGVENVEGPHFPEPHRWYARVQVVDGVVVKVLS